MKDNLNIVTKLTKSTGGRGMDIAVNKSDVPGFLKFIGSSPVRCYEYKWKDGGSKKKKIERRERAKKKYHLKIPGYYGYGIVKNS